MPDRRAGDHPPTDVSVHGKGPEMTDAARRAPSIAGVLALIAGLVVASKALAACPIELSVYGDRDKVAEINFTPTEKSAATANTFRMILEKDVVLDGIVMWGTGAGRPNGMLMHKCPEGDVTGEELAVCTVWQGVIYTSDRQGNIALLPAKGTAAPSKLIFPDLGPSLTAASAFGPEGLAKTPWDVFEMIGCQE